ncbi:MAG: carboxypeptidase regulatory-like domain-containing protein [Sedimenticola sp.]|nr:carboxypeptidase regulatory-like domain-containing protein [Sedimenticola sp.]
MMKSGTARLLYCLLLLIMINASVAHAETPGPLGVKVFEQNIDGTRKPLANVRIHIGDRHAATDVRGMAIFEGLPGGEYKLSVEQADYQSLSQEISLANGAREAIELTLTPAAVVQWGGQVVIDALDQPITGVMVELDPVKVKSSLSGRAHSITTWDGRFQFVDLPVGQYRLSATAPGFTSINQEVDVLPVDRSKQAQFDAPKVDGVALDICREWGKNCNKPTADLFCQQQGYFESDTFGIEKDQPPTRIISSGKLCKDKSCDRISWIKCIGEKQEPLVLKLKAEAKTISQVIRVTDGVTGQPIPDASVQLAETWPSGAIAGMKSDRTGRVSFQTLKLGVVNRQDEQGGVLIARRQVTAHVEAEGYVPAVVPLMLSEGSSELGISLTPLVEQEEVEPNNDFEHAQTVRIGAPIRLRIAERGDQDFFKFRLTEPSRLLLSIDGGSLETLIQLRDNDGKLLKEQGGGAGKTNRFERDLNRGSYSVAVTEWGNNGADPEQSMILNLIAKPAVDPNEPNQDLESARVIHLNQQVSGLIWPVGDHDFYKLEVKQAGILRLSDLHKSLQRHVKIYSNLGKLLAEQGGYANKPLSLEYAAAPGTYVIEIQEWGSNDASLEPYRLAVEMLPDDGVVDPVQEPGEMRAARSLQSHTWFASTILPIGDRDLFSVNIPGAGVLRMQSKGPMQRHLKVFDAEGKLLQQVGAYENSPGELNWHADGPQTVFVSIEEWGNNSYSPLPYSMRVWFERADEIDYQQRNETFEEAAPLLPGDTVHGSYLPLGDQDYYAVDIDFPGVLQVSAVSAQQTHLRVFDSRHKMIAERGAYENKTAGVSPEVNRGIYYILVSEWGNNTASTEPYELKVSLQRAEPGETEPLVEDEPRELHDGVAQSFSIDQRGDRDRFVFELEEAGEIRLNVASQVQIQVRVFDDHSGEKIHESGHYDPVKWSLPLKFDQPVRLRIELNEWGNNATSKQPGFIMIDTRGRTLQADHIESTPDGSFPERVSFKRVALKHADPAQRCELDLDGDGRTDLSLDSDQEKKGRFPREGRYVVESKCIGADGQIARQRFWVQATGNRTREGIALFLNTPLEGQTIDRPVKLLAQAISYSGRPVAGVRYRLDGQALATVYSTPYDAEVNWQTLSAGKHTVEVVAYDANGVEAKVSRQFNLSEYFDLSPPDGAVLSGEVVRVSWQAPQHGESLLRYRKKGSKDWQVVRGESGRLRVVELKGLEATVPYEIQPMGGLEDGPIQTLTRVKGLAFGRSRYGANIRRDYDQRVGISVRNNSDEPLSVRLECGKPKDSDLLVSFVGEGSEDKPINLGPGETRDFLLGISAQDVDTADHTVPIRIVSDSGLSDEAEVAVHVRLPHVELVWEDLGPLPLGHGRKLRLRNKGDTITDLQVSSEKNQAVRISPTIQHGLLTSGGSLEFTVTPRFYEGFQGVQSKILARGLDKSFNYPYEMKLAEGESVRRIWLFPGIDPTDDLLHEKEPELIANAVKAEQLDPSEVDWSRYNNPEDLDRDGRADRWSMNLGDVRWVGDDTDADGEVDFIHADIADDGIFEYSAILENEEWHKTNLVEAWLEMGFSLPWNRTSYHPHDTDIVLNGIVIGSLRDTIPEGNYSFRIPPAALRFDKSGLPGSNKVGINSKHLRGGHYVVNSDFRFKFRLTATPVWTVAKTEADARRSVAQLGGVAITSPDLSISSAELRLDAPDEAKVGDEIKVEIPVRNLGSVAVPEVDVVLFRKNPRGRREELARVVVDRITLHGAATAKFAWKATAGSSRFMLVVDPDNRLDDIDNVNNEAIFFLPIKSDKKPIKITLNKPKANGTSATPMITLQATVNPEAGIVEPSLSIDGGLWQELQSTSEKITAELLLQPGKHRLQLKVVDAAGNSATETIELEVKAPAPEARIVSPRASETIAERHAHVVIAIPENLAMVAVRAAGGPWHKAVRIGTEAHVDLPIRFGNQTIEAIVADKSGVVNLLTQDIVCSAQPKADEKRVVAGAEQEGLLWPRADSDLAIDLFQTRNGILQLTERKQRRAAPESAKETAANTAAMDPNMRARYEEAKRLRMVGARLQGQGELTRAIEKYRQSLRLYPDYRLEAHIALIEDALNGRLQDKGR